MDPNANDIDALAVTTIRTLAIDTVEKANSGHPGLPMGAAPMAYVLWNRFLRFNPQNPRWVNRDRFVLSAGHGSALLYALLHLTGFDLPLEELERFRRLGSLTPGHPEYGLTPGVETTTGPLGQGFATAVGMAMAEQHLAAQYNRDGFPIIDHHTFALVSDGDLMEGISSEAASLAGHLGLGKIVFLYDQNHISIEGSTELAFTENVLARFDAYGWHTQRVEDGNDLEGIGRAIAAAKAETARPSLIAVHTHIGFGSPNKQDTAGAHGSALGAEEVRLTKEAYGWPADRTFYIPDAVKEHFGHLKEWGQSREDEWNALFGQYQARYPEAAEQLKAALAGDLPSGWTRSLPTFQDGPIATRAASGQVLNALVKILPTLFGGSADLAPSTDTHLKDEGDFSPSDHLGKNLHFGVREHAMAAALNGMSLHGGLHVFGGTFLIFSDYLKPALRLSCLMHQPVVYVFTHDSIALGEDGPTHQPVEQLAALRAIPNLITIRPADANETRVAWEIALETREHPVAMILSRQKLPVLSFEKAREAAKGAYIARDAESQPDVILIATGAEVHLALAAQTELAQHGVGARVVSMPSWELFDRQPRTYRDAILPPAITARVAIEAASPLGWERYIGQRGKMVGMTTFGASAPGEDALRHFGFTVENVIAQVQNLLNGGK